MKYEAWQFAVVEEIIQERNELVELADRMSRIVPTWMLDSLLAKGLDGDEPSEFPLLVNAFYKGSKNPMQKAYRAWNRYMKVPDNTAINAIN